MADYFLDARIREGAGDRIALLYRDQRISYGEVQRRSNQVATALVEAGVRPEERVLIVLPDRPEFAAAFFGILKMGGVVAMVDPSVRTEGLAYFLSYTRATAAFVPASSVGRLAPSLGGARGLRAVFAVGEGDPGRHLAWAGSVEGASNSFETLDVSDDDQAVWLFTSGSTGEPKAAMHNHSHFPWNTERYAKGVLRLGPGDVTASAPKLFFGYATGTNLMFPFAVGAAAVLYEPLFSAEGMFRVIETYRPTVLSSLPSTIQQMLEGDSEGRRDLSSLRFTVSAGEALAPELHRRWNESYGVEILDGLGSAEMFHIYVTNFPGRVVPGSLGRLVPGYDARVVDDEERPVARGEVGTLWVKGESALTGYYRSYAKTRRTLRGEFVVTGDHVREDEDGNFWYAGRADDLFKVRGRYVSPLEVENRMLEHPGVSQVAVVGADGPDGVPICKAFVVPTPGVEGTARLSAEIVQHTAGALDRYKVPSEIVFLTELPRTANGKVQRQALRSQAGTR